MEYEEITPYLPNLSTKDNILMKTLQNYIQALISIKEIRDSRAFKEFFELKNIV